MERLIRNPYALQRELSLEEAFNLFDALRYYGKQNTLELAEFMFHSSESVPLNNHWEDFDEFLHVWDVFYKMSRNIPRASFGKTLISCQVPQVLNITQDQRDFLARRDIYMREVCYLLSFFDSISDYFEFEVQLIECGFFPQYKAAS